MLYKLLVFLGLIGADSANFDPANPTKLEVNLEKTQMDTMNRLLQDEFLEPDTREVFRDHLDSMNYDAKSKNTKLVFRFK